MNYQILFSRKNKKNVLQFHLLKVLPSIQSANLFSDFFGVRPYTGRVFVKKDLVYHTGIYNFEVMATDERGQGPFTAIARVTIEVLPSANSPPIWIIPPKDNATIYVLEVNMM